MAADPDRYEAYYAEKLWQLLPQTYRSEDSDAFDRKGPLREMVDRIGAQAAILRRSIDRLWDDQSIETCDDWVIPYIGDLLSTNLIAAPPSCRSPGRRSLCPHARAADPRMPPDRPGRSRRVGRRPG